MFYSQFILAKKGPLGTIWIAAHLERKLRKNQVTETNISVSVDSILFPEVPIALRLSGHLLLGVVRIYSRKVNYLFHDCSEALVKIKQAFHAGAVDLPPEAATAPFHSITLPETFDLDEFEPLLDKELNLLHSNGTVDHHVSSREQITLQDPLEDSTYLGSSQFELDERFPEGDAPRLEMDFDEGLLDKASRERSPNGVTLEEEEEMTLEEDVLPPTRMDEPLDYDRMDRMEAMDVDDQHEPGTPAIGLDHMDLDDQQEAGEIDERDGLQRIPDDDLDRLEPNFAMDDNEDLHNLLGEEQPVHLEPITPGSPEHEHVDYRESGDEQGEEEKDDRQEEEHVGLRPVDAELGEENQEERLEKQVEEEAAEKKLEEEEEMPQKEESVGVEEVQGAIEEEEKDDLVQSEEQQKEVPDYETVMSAPEATSQEPGVFDLENDMDLKGQAAGAASDFQHPGQTLEDGDLMVEDEAVPPIQDDPQSVTHQPMSPMRSPPLPTISSEDLPGDDDVLASLLGRGTPALNVLPTPVESVAARPRRRQGQRKRKIVTDMVTILAADVMKQQLQNTDSIRRVRRRAPCTPRELWSMQREGMVQQMFCESSTSGLAAPLHALYERVYVVGEANLPLADPPEPEVAARDEDAPEQPQSTPVVEDLNADVTERADPLSEPVVEEEIQVAFDDFQHIDGAGPTDGFSERFPSSQTGEVPVEDLQRQLSPKATPEREEQAATTLSKGGTATETEAEVNAVDLNFESFEMAEAMEAELGERRPMIDVNQENPEEEKEIAQVEEEGRAPEFVDIQETADTQPWAEGTLSAVPGSEIEGETLPVAEAETGVGFETEIEPSGPEAGPEAGYEVGPETELEAGRDTGPEEADVKEAPTAVETELVATEAHQEGEVYELKQQEDAPPLTFPDQRVQAESALATAAPESVPAPAEEQPDTEELEFVADTRDTEFLGADDDDLAEEADDFQEANEYAGKEPMVQDNSGWSARTRAVGHYLRITLEDKDTYMRKRNEQGAARLGLGRMLVGKTRKEAARMFFETLVLKTKDYIHVEQDVPYGDIQISARPKLQKANF